MNMNDFKFERGMYWKITEFDGTQEEALAFIVPKMMRQGFELAKFMQDADEQFYQPLLKWKYIAINVNGFINVYDPDDEEFLIDENGLGKQSWDVFKTVTESTTDLEECHAKIDSLEELVSSLSDERTTLIAAVKTLQSIITENFTSLDSTDYDALCITHSTLKDIMKPELE